MQSIETSKDHKVSEEAILNGFLLRDKLSGEVYFRSIVTFHLIAYISSAIYPHLLVQCERHSFLRGTVWVAFLFEHHAEAQASTEIWKEEEEVSGTEEK